jgi:uncharacterized protein YcfJ
MLMQKLIPLALSAALVMTAAPSEVMAKGCLRGAVAGGVAGHYMGHHAVVGAVGGCVAAHEYYKHKARQQAMARQNGH